MKTNLLTLVITLTIGIILMGSLMAPVISDAQDSIGVRTFTNTGDKVYLVEEADDYTITPTTTGWKVNDTDITCTGTYKFIYTDTTIGAGYSYLANVNMDLYELGSVVNGITSITLSADGTAVYTINLTDHETTWEWFALSSDDGEYVLTNGAAYVPSGVTHWVYPIGTNITTPGVGFLVDSENGAATLTQAASRSSTTLTDISSSSTASIQTSDYSTTVSVAYSSNTYTLGAIVPVTVKYQEDTASGVILGAIMVVFAVGLVVAAISIIRVRD